MSMKQLYYEKKKNTSVAILYCLLLGSVGAHWLYLKKTTRGTIYIGLAITGLMTGGIINLIMAVVALVELFSVGNYVKEYNLLLKDRLGLDEEV